MLSLKLPIHSHCPYKKGQWAGGGRGFRHTPPDVQHVGTIRTSPRVWRDQVSRARGGRGPVPLAADLSRLHQVTLVTSARHLPKEFSGYFLPELVSPSPWAEIAVDQSFQPRPRLWSCSHPGGLLL